MKLVHLKKKDDDSGGESGLRRAMELEKEGLNDEAKRIYKAIIQANPHDEKAYDRLMIIYRKQKDTESELKLIDKAVSTFKSWFEKKSPFMRSKKIGELSSSISKMTGLTEKKTDLLFTREPLARWQQRKKLLLAKSHKKSK
jgi:tetratricopeptide (TPR) repeat protein